MLALLLKWCRDHVTIITILPLIIIYFPCVDSFLLHHCIPDLFRQRIYNTFIKRAIRLSAACAFYYYWKGMINCSFWCSGSSSRCRFAVEQKKSKKFGFDVVEWWKTLLIGSFIITIFNLICVFSTHFIMTWEWVVFSGSMLVIVIILLHNRLGLFMMTFISIMTCC